MKLPWEAHSTTYYKSTAAPRRIHMKTDPSRRCKVIKEYIDDTPRQYWRKGDIVKFDDGFISKYIPDWKGWFLTKKDKEKYWLKNPNTPAYARNQFAIIIGRYRLVKFKYETFRDYGSVIMMLTGSRIGHTRHYFMGYPYERKLQFPNPPIFKYLKKVIPQSALDILSDHYEDTNEGRSLLASKMYYNFNS